MKLSIIIVNYNVEFFLEQCLLSVQKALKNVSGEIIVVDNNSVDGSVNMIKRQFPDVVLIENKENTGFSRANNQGIKLAKGEYVLLLNPDTVVEEDTFSKVLKFMDEHPDAGGLGVKMVDGKGRFLPESKRGLPTPAAAFYKIFGISRLFPKSKRFGKYHLGYLSENETHEIEILSGAFMLMRKKTLDEVGLLDETFFMYGEDIDLSYRIIKGGWKNYYFPHTKIIHYKGESTKKSSVNYVFVFYNAMIIFAEKHFSKQRAGLFSFFIKLAIYFRASVAILNRFIQKTSVPAIDFAVITSLLFVLAHFYQKFSGKQFDFDLLKIALPSYAFAWLIANYFSGGYDKPFKPLKALRGLLAGTGLILIIYALLPKEVQFSRLFILLGTVSTLLGFFLMRLLLTLFKKKDYSLTSVAPKRFGIIGNEEEAERVLEVLKQTNHIVSFSCLISPKKEYKGNFVGSIYQIDEILNVHKLDELIFCAKDNAMRVIIETMSSIQNKKVDFKIAQPESLYLIGSNSIDTSGDLYSLNVNTIDSASNRRKKRLLDVFTSLTCIVLLPLLILTNKRKNAFVRAVFQVIIGSKTWVGYASNYTETTLRLPKLKPSVFSIIDKSALKNEDKIDKINLIYAKDYSVMTDVKIILKNLNRF